MSDKPSITRVVKFIKKGERGGSVIVADTSSRHYTYAQWQTYGATGHLETWGSINNADKFRVGDTIVINGVCSDRGNIGVSLYATVGAVNVENKSVTATTTSLIMSGENGTGITPKGECKAHFANFSAISGSKSEYDKFIVDSSSDYSETYDGETKTGFAAPSVMTYQNAPDFTWYCQKAEIGDTYINLTDGHLWVAEEKIWKDAGKVKGDDGEDGEDGISIVVTGENVVFTKINQVLNVYVEVFKGGQRLKYGTSKDGFSCSTLSSGHYLLDNNVYWGFTTDDGGYRFCYRLLLLNKVKVNGEVPFTITAIGLPYSRTLRISTVFDGEKGERGPALRGPQDWEKLPVGYSFQAGKDGDEWKDVVVYKGNYASCIKGHTKTSTNYPGSTDDSNNGYWSVTNKWEIVATNILLTSYALIKNLGVEVIDMKDSDGNILFQAKDGTVICNIGNFKNINVDGNITSRMLRLPFIDISAFDMENGTVINPLNYGCNLKIRNTDREAYLAIPANETLEGLYLRIYEPVVTRMAGLTSLTGRFIVGNDTYSNPIIVNKITPKANTLCEMLCISTDNLNYSWQIVNTDTCDF
jgi:hypothetical protein